MKKDSVSDEIFGKIALDNARSDHARIANGALEEAQQRRLHNKYDFQCIYCSTCLFFFLNTYSGVVIWLSLKLIKSGINPTKRRTEIILQTCEQEVLKESMYPVRIFKKASSNFLIAYGNQYMTKLSLVPIWSWNSRSRRSTERRRQTTTLWFDNTL